MRYFALNLILFSLIACNNQVSDGRPAPTPPPEPPTFSEGPVSGSIEGQAWEFLKGRAEARIVNGENRYLVELWDQDVADICDPFVNVTRGIIFSIPAAAGTYELSLQQTVNFYVNNTSMLAREGSIKIEPINGHQLSGALRAIFDADTNANGEFDVTICD